VLQAANTVESDLDPFSVDNSAAVQKFVGDMVRPPKDLVGNYLRQSKRVSFELADGSFSLAVIDVVESRLALLILLPISATATIFVPKPGTQLIVSFGGKSIKAYYPGTYSEVPELQTGFMSLIKAEAEESL
jgi:hypothetical protein